MKLTIFLFWIFAVFNVTHADELWVDQENTSRTYFSVIENDQGVSVKKYFQVKGDYQEPFTQKDFNTLEEARNYISKFDKFEKVDELESWPVNYSGKSSFGRLKNKSIWIAQNKWNDEWELRYAQWVQENVKSDFYVKYNIATDCADAVVGIRWIFARIHSLPAANTLADTNSLFGNFSVLRKWENLSTSDNWYDDQLFMSALRYLMDLASTKTVVKDGYPVKITKEGLVPGSFIIFVGHAKIISETHYDDPSDLPFYTLSSTTPRAVRELMREAFIDQEWPYQSTKDIMSFRWPEIQNSRWTLRTNSNHSRFSLEQYDPALRAKYPAFISFVLSRVKENYDPIRLIDYGVKEISDYLNVRIQIVNDGHKFCKTYGCPLGSAAYEDWSTPSRDEKILKKYIELGKIVKDFEVISPGLYEKWINQLNNFKMNILGRELSLSEIRYLFENKLTSSDPNVSPERRWGF